MNLRKPFQMLLLWLVVLGIYYPAIFAGVNSVDDQRMFISLEQMVQAPWVQLFYPTGGLYYRPLLMLTFRLDYLFWGQEAGFYHLENLLIHGANATLVFFILFRLARPRAEQPTGSVWPLLGALLFALHPIATESVDWISGRTDLLGGFFVLAATLVLMHAVQEGRLAMVAASLPLLAAAVTSKEVMVFFLPAACFLVWRFGRGFSGTWRLRAVALLAVPFACAGGIFLAARWLRYGAGGELDRLIHQYHYGAFDTVRVFFKVLGFYAKKLLLPLPLNFAIRQVNDQYVWLGLIVLLVAFILLGLRHPGIDLVLTSWYLILPGILIALIGVAWTPLAERYIYLPSAFFIMGMIVLLSRLDVPWLKSSLPALSIAFLLFPAGMATAQRNLTWQDNAALFGDTMSKSPQFAAMNNELAIALINSGELQRAAEILEEGKHLPSASPLLYINQARIRMMQGDLDGARAELLEICQDKDMANIEALKMLANLDEQRLREEGTTKDILPDLVETYRKITVRTHNPALEYRMGQLLLAMKEHQEALRYFKGAYERAPADAFYREAAGKLVDKLAAGEGR